MACTDVIVIEDDMDIRESVREILEWEGYHVRVFANGKDALEGLSNGAAPCIILLDLMMPVMNGLEFLEARKRKGNEIMKIPVVIVSAFSDMTKNAEGVVGYIKKPIDIDLLLHWVGQNCKRKQVAA